MSRVCAAFEPYPESREVWRYLAARFGFAESDFAGHRLWHRPGIASIWLAHQDCRPTPGLRVQGVGLMAFRRTPPRGYPTSAFLRRFGARARDNVYDVGWDTAMALMHEVSVPMAPLDERGGPYIVRCAQTVIGRGWVRAGRLRLDAPRMWRQQLLPLASA